MSRKKIKNFTEAPPDKVFRLHSGGEIKNLMELRDILRSISDEDFNFHVSHEKNDFAQWVEDVLNDSDLAIKMRRKWTKPQILYVVDTHLKAYYEGGVVNG